MKNKTIGIFVMTLMIVVTLLPIVSSLNNDQVDQQQTEGHFSIVFDNIEIEAAAQSFKPTLPILSRVELYVTGHFKCSIKDSLNGIDLKSDTKSFTGMQDWHFFDFQNLSVTPGQTYYIVLELIGNSGCWGGYSEDDLYQQGSAWYKKTGQGWQEYQFSGPTDFQFKTYGYPGTVHLIPFGGGSDAWFNWIQDAIDAASPNDIIEVYDPDLTIHPTGKYVENLILNKDGLTLKAAPYHSPTIDGDGNDIALKVTGAADVEVRGFKIENGLIGIRVIGSDSKRVKINNNTIQETKTDSELDSAIFVLTYADECQIEYNSIINNDGPGIYLLNVAKCKIENNLIGNNQYDGITLFGARKNYIKKNKIVQNDEIGINIEKFLCGGVNCYGNTIIDNEIAYNTEIGIKLDHHSYNNIVTDNYVTNNQRGIVLDSSSCKDNLIFNNYFDNSKFNSQDKGRNTWNISRSQSSFITGESTNILGGNWFGGNYWSDYNGLDDGSGPYPHNFIDGLGDTQLPYKGIHPTYYIINGGDHHPLIPSAKSNLECSGTLSWSKVNPGRKVTGDFTIENIGEPDSKLDWEITDYPDWGTWAFEPSDGEGLTTEELKTLDVTVTAPEEKDTFNGEIKIINSENPKDSCTIPISLSTQKTKQKTIETPLLKIFENYPILLQLLQRILKL